MPSRRWRPGSVRRAGGSICLIQVGDLGAYPKPERMDVPSQRYLAADPAQADFSRLLRAGGARAESIRRVRVQFATAIHFVRGNHEDFARLHGLPVDAASGTAPIDPFDLFHYVPDGTLLHFDDLTVGFLGGVEERHDAAGIDQDAYEALLELGPDVVDVLVTHGGPYGSSICFRGDTHGSLLVTRLLKQFRPAFHIAGHAHQPVGPRPFESTTYLGLDYIVASALWNPDACGLQPGCLGD